MKTPSNFECHNLDNTHTFCTGRLPDSLVLNSDQFDALWQMHPPELHLIKIHGRLVHTPRWQQAYGMDYYYTGRVNKALPIPPLLNPLVNWAKENIDERLNGILVNFYDGKLDHKIGPHHDSIKNMVSYTPIVTISFGEGRIFRLRPAGDCKHATPVDFQASNGAVFIMPFETNLAFKHEVPSSKRLCGRRISVTLRALIEIQD